MDGLANKEMLWNEFCLIKSGKMRVGQPAHPSKHYLSTIGLKRPEGSATWKYSETEFSSIQSGKTRVSQLDNLSKHRSWWRVRQPANKADIYTATSSAIITTLFTLDRKSRKDNLTSSCHRSSMLALCLLASVIYAWHGWHTN